MGDNTKIEWCDHTFNPWIGCTKVSVGELGACVNCYAEVATPTRAMHIMWGAGQPRHRTSPSTWALPLKWERNAEALQATHGRRQRIFCASLADVFDNEVPHEWRSDLFRLIYATPHLDWLLLTKRIGNVSKALAVLGDEELPPHVWLGITVANQEEADRDIPKLLATPARVRFLSCEPLLGPINARAFMWPTHWHWDAKFRTPEDALAAGAFAERKRQALVSAYATFVDWVIAGGESGGLARPSHPQWFRDLRDQCVAAGVPFHFKQWGEWIDHDQRGVDMLGTARSPLHRWPDDKHSVRIGKKATGRLLDGRTWDQFPQRASE